MWIKMASVINTYFTFTEADFNFIIISVSLATSIIIIEAAAESLGLVL